jgi:hypothetical protein
MRTALLSRQRPTLRANVFVCPEIREREPVRNFHRVLVLRGNGPAAYDANTPVLAAIIAIPLHFVEHMRKYNLRFDTGSGRL